MHFILSGLAVAFASLGLGARGSLAKRSRPMTWAERLALLETKSSTSRRWEQYLHVKYCAGGFDHLHSDAEVALRKARCANICGLCRHINSLARWPDSTYRRPPQAVLDALERQQWCLPYNMTLNCVREPGLVAFEA